MFQKHRMLLILAIALTWGASTVHADSKRPTEPAVSKKHSVKDGLDSPCGPILCPQPQPQPQPPSLPSYCVNGQPTITLAELSTLAQAGTSAQTLRQTFCVDPSAPTAPPAFTDGKQTAYTWVSNQLYPGSGGDIRSLYGSTNISWGSLPWPGYGSSCACSNADFDAVVSVLRSEISAIANVTALFNALGSDYVNPLFIEEGGEASAVVSALALPSQTVAIHTGTVLDNIILDTLQNTANGLLGKISPLGPVMVTTLLNISQAENGGPVQSSYSYEAAQLETLLPQAFQGVLNQMSSLNTQIFGDYGLYMAIGLHEPGVAESQWTLLVGNNAKTYQKQLYRDLLPLVANIVFYAPSDSHLGGGGNVYAASDATAYSQPSLPQNQITYLHYAGYIWSSKTNYTTTSQLLTSTSTYDSGDSFTGVLCANNLLAPAVYQAVFGTFNFSYAELLALPGMQTKQQCSLCSGSACNGNCRPNNSCR